ncbi:hypothetical protein [Halosolutus gelatinilyticus]|uniref:hypothetical protein n=1 Tax=Halosolutus gelatinilyticus TaxID=2931975 RepID=UPI001FF30537|nr:hypothetical protein [Halosolutus gelatinilyticus]
MSRYGPRIAALARRAERDREAVDPYTATADEAIDYLREGAGPAIWLYVEGRTGGRLVPFSKAEFEALERAMNRWLECYACCHGVELDAAFTLREAAELLLETRNVVDTAQLLTCVPERRTVTSTRK